MIAQAIETVVEKASVQQKAPPKQVSPAHKEEVKKKIKKGQTENGGGGTVHEANMDAEAIDEQLRQLVKQRYNSVQTFFNEATKGDGISRKEWKAALQRLGMRLSDAARKRLRKRIVKDGSKVIRLETLSVFIGGVMSSTEKAGDSGDDSRLCFVPTEVPDLPAKFQARESPLNALIDALVSNASATVSLTAPKSRQSNKVASHGMVCLLFYSCAYS